MYDLLGIIGQLEERATMGMRNARVAATAVTAALVLAACGGGDSDSSGGGGDDSAASTTTLTIWADELRAPALEEASKPFEDENGVTIDIEVLPGDQLQSQFVTATQAGEGPDLVVGAHDWTGNLVQNSVISPVQLSADTVAGYNPLAIEGVTFNGQTYGVPIAVENVVLFRNTDVVPDAPATIEDMVAAGQAAVAAGQASEVLALPVGENGDAYHIYPFFTSGGGTLFGKNADGDYDPSQLGIGSAESLAAWQQIAALGAQGVLKTSITTDNIASLFTDGTAPFMVSGPWQIPTLTEAGINYDISPVPGFANGGPARPFVGVQELYVAAGTDNEALAQEYATNFFTSVDVQVALFNADPRPPALTAALEQVQGDNPDIAKVLSAGADGDILPAIPEMSAVFQPMGILESSIVGGADVPSAVQSAADTITAAIN